MPPPTSAFDFRRPSKLGRETARALDMAHETFARRVGTGWGAELRAYVQVEPAGMAQMPYDDVIRSMPTPHLLVTAEAAPLPGSVVIDLDLQLGLTLVDRLLGGESGSTPAELRRPSEVEVELLGHLGQMAVRALAEILTPLGGGDPRLVSVDVNPQLVQVAAPSDPALLVAFMVTVSGPVEARGVLDVVYPASMMNALLEHLSSSRAQESAEKQVDEQDATGLLQAIGAAEVDVAVQLTDSAVAAADLARLAVGDVLRLDHRVGRPACALVDGTPVLDVHIGRLGPRRAAQVAQWRSTEQVPPTSRSLRALVRSGAELTTTTDDTDEVPA